MEVKKINTKKWITNLKKMWPVGEWPRKVYTKKIGEISSIKRQEN